MTGYVHVNTHTSVNKCYFQGYTNR